MVVAADTLLARTTLRAYLRVTAGEPVTVETWTPGLSWARAFVVEARRLGARPLLALEDEDGFFRSLAFGGALPTAPAPLASVGGAYVYLGGPEAFPRLFGLRPADLAAALERHDRHWTAAARASRLRGVRLAISGVTPTAAARFGVRVEAWRSEVVAASLVLPPRLAAGARALLRRLARARRLAVRHGNGTRLDLRLRPGRWTEETGRAVPPAHRADAVWTAVPTGRLRFPVDAGSVHGTWEANRPAYDRLGEEPVAVGARFRFHRGRLEEATFDRGGEAILRAVGRREPHGARVLGLSFGLNPQVQRAPELGDLARGTVGLWIAPAGASASPPVVALLQGAEVEVDGELLRLPGGALAR